MLGFPQNSNPKICIIRIDLINSIKIAHSQTNKNESLTSTHRERTTERARWRKNFTIIYYQTSDEREHLIDIACENHHFDEEYTHKN